MKAELLTLKTPCQADTAATWRTQSTERSSNLSKVTQLTTSRAETGRLA